MARAKARTARVLARPGRPSRSTCPPDMNVIRIRSTRASWPTMTFAISALIFSTKLFSAFHLFGEFLDFKIVHRLAPPPGARRGRWMVIFGKHVILSSTIRG